MTRHLPTLVAGALAAGALASSASLAACAASAPSHETIVPLTPPASPVAASEPPPVEEALPVPRVRKVVAEKVYESEPVELKEEDDVGVVGGIPGGVVGGVPGGVMGGVPGGVAAGIAGGVVGGVPAGAGVPLAPSSRARRAAPMQTTVPCAFPPEADAERIDSARVVLIVTVDTAGKAVKASIVSDPGHGFGRAARECALKRSYTPGLDDTGQSAQSTTPPIVFLFKR